MKHAGYTLEEARLPGRTSTSASAAFTCEGVLYRGRFDSPKYRSGLRAVPLTEGLARALWRLRGTAPDEAPIFASRGGTHLDPSNVAARVLEPAAKRAVGRLSYLPAYLRDDALSSRA